MMLGGVRDDKCGAKSVCKRRTLPESEAAHRQLVTARGPAAEQDIRKE